MKKEYTQMTIEIILFDEEAIMGASSDWYDDNVDNNGWIKK